MTATSRKLEIAKAVAMMCSVPPGDQESAHAEADRILLDYLRATGAGDLADAWERLSTEAGGFWYA